MRHPLIIASSNQGKIDEFAQLLRPCPFNVLSASSIGGMPPVEENGSSFLENAIIKAEALHARAPEHHWVLADDSGLGRGTSMERPSSLQLASRDRKQAILRIASSS